MNEVNTPKLIKIISKIIKINEKKLNIKSKADDFDSWDSMAQVSLMIEISKKYKVDIPPSIFASLDIIKKIIQYLKKR